ncbi:MAG: class I SAM-dependent methyltransferase [Chlorobia bacterium]|nr:class I SAM-dependent methyltransferase [Fimbriimonadaceae bacterium]
MALKLDSYRSLCTEVYGIDKPTAPADALDFYLAYARESKGPILEPMCGSGRFLIPMLESGLEVDGIDASASMLDLCRQKCRDRGLKSNLYEGFIQEIELDQKYGLAFIPSGSFTLITDANQARLSLQRLRDAMLPGAKLVLEAGQNRGAESISWPWGGKWWDRPAGGKIVLSWMGHYDTTTGIAHSIHRYELVVDGQLVKTEFEDFDTRTYDRSEMIRMLEDVGFVNVRVLTAYANKEPDREVEDVVYECARP